MIYGWGGFCVGKHELFLNNLCGKDSGLQNTNRRHFETKLNTYYPFHNA